MPVEGVEPTRGLEPQRILNPSRMPVPPHRPIDRVILCNCWKQVNQQERGRNLTAECDLPGDQGPAL